MADKLGTCEPNDSHHGIYPHEKRDIYVNYRESEQPSPERCKRTGNPVGTDTWAAGYECPCEPCKAYSRQLTAKAKPEAGEALFSVWQFEFKKGRR